MPYTDGYLSRKGGLVKYFPAVSSGSLLVFAFPTPGLSLLAWICIVPFLISLYRMDGRTALRAGLLFGLPYFFGTQYWIYHSINHYGGLSFPASISIVFLLCLAESLYLALFGLLFSRIIKRTDLPVSLLAPPLWCSLEYIRGYLFTGFPWSLLGYSQHGLLSVIQVSDITGVYGVSFLVLLVNSVITDLILIKQRRADKPLFPAWRIALSSMAGIFILISALVYGVSSLQNDEEITGRSIRVAVIQGNIEQDRKWDPRYQREVIETYKGLTREALKEPPDLVVWPETALPFYYGTDPVLSGELQGFVREISTPLLTGSMLIKNYDSRLQGEDYILSNSAVLINRDGKTAYTYDKIHLVPFGEYVPLKNILFFIDKLVAGIGDFQKGKKYILAKTEAGQFGTIICYEVIFPGLVRKFFREDGDFIVNITNDAWFGRTTGPYQHFSMAVFRAVENRKPLVRSANTGISGIVDSAGRIISSTGLFKESVIVEEIKAVKRRSFYTIYGDLFSFLCITFTVITYGLKLGLLR